MAAASQRPKAMAGLCSRYDLRRAIGGHERAGATEAVTVGVRLRVEEVLRAASGALPPGRRPQARGYLGVGDNNHHRCPTGADRSGVRQSCLATVGTRAALQCV